LVFQDSLEEPKQEFLISVKRSAVLLEDIGSIQEFVDRTEQYFGLLYDELGNALGHIARMGVRIIEICAPRSEPTFEAMNTLVVSRFLTLPRDLTPNVVDSMLRVIHHHGYLHVGPIRAEELWTKTMFRDPASAVPPAGIGLDIDSYQAGIVIKDSADLRRAFIAVFGLTKAVEESALRQLGLLDEQ
jgi:hypothetical protein